MGKAGQQFYQLKNMLSETLELPKDIMLDLPRITLVGNIQMQIENHRGIVIYDGHRVRLSLARGVLDIYGENLTIRAVDKDQIIIDGQLVSIQFVE